MRSAIYEGVVTHRRHAAPETGHVAHAFTRRVTMVHLFLDEVDELVARHPLWSATRWRPVLFRRRDYLGDPATPLDDAVRDVVAERLGTRPRGPVAMLGQLRTWGWLFNPLTLYYCYDEDVTHVEAVVLEVTSTPWHERHVYVIDGRDRHARFAKAMHVSPFLGMDQEYEMRWTTPAEAVAVHLVNRQGATRLFDAGLALTRRAPTHAELARLVWRRPLRTYAVSTGIYREALTLWRRGAPFHPRHAPGATTSPVTTAPRSTASIS
ncbi:MAG: DUF1365 domain-containing protein [Acidimicrobiales bacterium]